MPFLFEMVLFWPFLVVGVLTLTLYAIFDDERSFFTLGIFAFIVAGLAWYNDRLELSVVNLMTAAYWFVAYFLAGTVWAVVKWWFHVKAARRYFNENEAQIRKNGDVNAKYYGVDWITHDDSKDTLPSSTYAPSVKNFKARISAWIAMWPWSFVWTLINDPITRLVKEIYHSLAKMLQRMSDKAFS